MLNLQFAPSLDMLVADLLKGVREVWRDPFEAPEILVPSPALGKWLSMRLTDGAIAGCGTVEPFGCVANLSFKTIERYLWELLRPDGINMLDQQDVQQVLCALLDMECISQPAFEPVMRYITGKEGIDGVKKVQLAARIANRFMEYEYNRPGVWRKEGRWDPQGIDGTWMKRDLYPQVKDRLNESWQAELYRRMRNCFSDKNSGGSSSEEQYLTLPQLYRLRREQGTPEGLHWTVTPRTIFMFGVAQISHFHRNLLVEISQMDGIEMYVYLTNPCAEFWEDVDTSRSRNHRRTWSSKSETPAIGSRKPDDYSREELGDLNDTTDHKLLKLWGHAGKENIFLWCQDAAWNFEYHCPAWVDNEQEPATVLEALRFSLLRRLERCMPLAGGTVRDPSLQILACPDRGREIEEIREQILDMVNDGTITMLNEVVVYLTDPIKYLPSIERVFGRFAQYDPEYIPYCILGVSGKDTLCAQGVKSLLEILQNRFDRAHFFELLRNPIVQKTRGIRPEDVSIWETWAEELSIFRGYNREHRSEMGDTGGTITDAHTFELGMARMLLAEIANGPVELHYREQAGSMHSGEEVALPVIPYRDFAMSDRENIERFCATVEALHRDGQRFRNEIENSIEKTIVLFSDLVSTWMGMIPETGVIDSATEGSMLKGLYDGLRKILLQQTRAGRKSIPLEEFCTLVSGCLPAEPAHHAAAWTGGITFAPLKPAMIVPQTVVFAAGLDDVLFPGSGEKPSWDVLAEKRIIGDSDRVRDNRFAFLELLHAARARLILSYRARNMQKEVELNASSVIQELESFLCESGYCTKNNKGDNVCAVSRTIPWIVHESLRTFVAAGRKYGSWNRDDRGLAAIARNENRKKHRYELDVSVAVSADARLSYHYSGHEIGEYLKNPLEYHLARTLEIDSEESPGTINATDEPLASGHFASAMLYKAVWVAVLREMFPANKSTGVNEAEKLGEIACREARRLYTLHIASGNAPEAMMEEIEKNRLFMWAATCATALLPLQERFTDHLLLEKTDLSLGRNGCSKTLVQRQDSGTTCSIDCSHNLVLVPRNGNRLAPAGILVVKKHGVIRENPALCTEGIVQLLYEKENDSALPPPVLVQLTFGDAAVECLHLSGNAEKVDKMSVWIGTIIGEMIRRGSDHFPFTAIEKITRPTKKMPAPWSALLQKVTRESVEAALTGEYRYRSFNPAFTLTDPLLPSDDSEVLRTLADRRFAPLLDGWIFEKETAA